MYKTLNPINPISPINPKSPKVSDLGLRVSARLAALLSTVETVGFRGVVWALTLTPYFGLTSNEGFGDMEV